LATRGGEKRRPSSGRRLDGAGDLRVAAERHVRAVVVVVGHILADGAEEVMLTHDDEVTEQLAAKGPDEAALRAVHWARRLVGYGTTGDTELAGVYFKRSGKAPPRRRDEVST
jgi:hypothetical protein